MDQFYDPTTVATLQGVFRLVVPEAVLVLFACVLFLGGAGRRGSRHLWGAIALAGIAAASVAMWLTVQLTLRPGVVTVSPIWPDALTFLIRVIALAGGHSTSFPRQRVRGVEIVA